MLIGPQYACAKKMAAGCWIYGAGNYGRKIAELMASASIPCLGFIDKRGDTIGKLKGLPVVSPSAFSSSEAVGRCFVSGIFNPTIDPEEIISFSEQCPFEDRLWHADLPEAFGEEANSIWLSSRSFILQNFESIRNVALALADRVSVDTYLSLILYRCTGRRADYPPYDLPTQYLPPDLPGFSSPIVFVDGGAYSGDTLLMLLKRGVKVRGWFAFEPDDGNFKKLVETARSNGVPSSLFPCGLSDHLHQARFVSDMGMGSRLISDPSANTTVIQCVALDEVIANVAPDFIKLDIEGSELAALNGMARTVAASRPRLAIGSYHKPEDLWVIPLKLLELLPGADLHIRQHSSGGIETVAYAIPKVSSP